jgi:hypothetical protein
MQPSWSIPVPQAMQQHGGPAKSPAPAPAQAGTASESSVCARDSVAARTNEAGPAR